MASHPRVVSPGPLVIHIYRENGTRMTYPNENFGSCDNVSLTRTRVDDKKSSMSLGKLPYPGI